MAFFCEMNLIRTNFTEISRKSEEFLQLELEQLIVILNSDELNVKSEEAVFNAVIRWIDYKVDERKQVGKEIEIFL
jgi:kelch-like protein 10